MKIKISVSRYEAKIVETKVKTEVVEIEVPDNATKDEIEDEALNFVNHEDCGPRIHGNSKVCYFEEIVDKDTPTG